MKFRVTIFLLILMMLSVQASAVTIYVNTNNTPPGAGTELDPYTTITNAMAHLAVTNAVVQGGHTIAIAPGAFTNQINVLPEHSGSNGSPNIFLATNGLVTLSNAVYAFFITNGVTDITIDGFDITQQKTAALRVGINSGTVPERIIIQNCNIYQNGDAYNDLAAVIIENNVEFQDTITIKNCNICFNFGSGIWTRRPMTIKNCIIMGNYRYGIWEELNRVISVSYCDLYANGWGNHYNSLGSGLFIILNSESEVNSLAECSNNIVRNPGFTDLVNWNFNSFYDISPCLGTGEGGVDIGRHQGSPTVTTSSNTYYVNADTGNDENTPTQATNPLTPWASIARATVTAIAGDTVRVAEGTYIGQVTIINSGCYGAPVTYVADGNVVVQGGTYGFYCRLAAGIVLDGFRVNSATSHGVYTEYGYGIEMQNLSVHNNTQQGVSFYRSGWNTLSLSSVYSNSNHGILFNYGASTTIERSSIYANTLDGINVIYHTLCNENNINNCNIYKNTRHGINFADGTITVKNCNLYSNGQNGLWHRNTPTVENCNFVSNTYYGTYRENGGVFVQYCNYFQNGLGGCRFDSSTTYTEADDINTLNGSGYSYTNNIAANPLFEDETVYDLRLQKSSPCIDAGTTNTVLEFDMYGNVRQSGPAVDIGSYEYIPLPAGTVFMFW